MKSENPKDLEKSIPTFTSAEEVEQKFSDLRGNASMEAILEAVKEYITEKGQVDETG